MRQVYCVRNPSSTFWARLPSCYPQPRFISIHALIIKKLDEGLSFFQLLLETLFECLPPRDLMAQLELEILKRNLVPGNIVEDAHVLVARRKDEARGGVEPDRLDRNCNKRKKKDKDAAKMLNNVKENEKVWLPV